MSVGDIWWTSCIHCRQITCKIQFPLAIQFSFSLTSIPVSKIQTKTGTRLPDMLIDIEICFSVHCTCHLGSHPSATEIILVLFPWCPCVPTTQPLHKPKTSGYYFQSKTYANRIWILTLPLQARPLCRRPPARKRFCHFWRYDMKAFHKPLLWISRNMSTFFPGYLLFTHVCICIPLCTYEWGGSDKETADRCVCCRECTFGSTGI